MNTLKITIPIGIGDLIYIKAMLDNVKHRYSEIHIRFRRDIIDIYGLDHDYNTFLTEIGELFFGESPYILGEEKSPFYELPVLCGHHNIPAIKPDLKHLLCKGQPLDINEEYIVVITKTRYMPKDHFNSISVRFFELLNGLSQKYKIVLLGEKEVQMNAGYLNMKNNIYSIYSDVINNLPADKIIDMTVPALGITAPKLQHIQQDSVILNKAKFVVTIGIGGGLCIASAVSKVIGYRIDDDAIANEVFKTEYSDATITKDFEYFISKLKGYI